MTSSSHGRQECIHRGADAASHVLRPRPLPRRTGTGRRRGPRRPRRPCRHADGFRKIARIPAARGDAPGHDARRVAADLADEGSGRRVEPPPDSGGRAAFDAAGRRPARGARLGTRGTPAAALCRARTICVRSLPAPAPRARDRTVRRGRGALRLGVGPRLPPRLPAPARRRGALSGERPRRRMAAEEDKDDLLPRLVRGRRALVYAATRKTAEAAGAVLRAAGVQAAAYHAGLEDEERTRV